MWDRPTREKMTKLDMKPALEAAKTCSCSWPPTDASSGDLCAPFPALCGMCQNVVVARYWDGVDGTTGECPGGVWGASRARIPPRVAR